MGNSRIAGITLLALLAAAATTAAQPANSPASVAGRVTNSVTGASIVRAHVNLTALSDTRQRYGALGTADGTFSIQGIPAGRYFVNVEAPGFDFPLGPAAGRPSSLNLAASEHRADLMFAGTPYASISGHILDAHGNPAQGIPVAVLAADGYSDSQPSAPDGAYRISRLKPGKYRVRAAPVTTYMPPEVRTDGSHEERYVLTYYPAALAPESADYIDLPAGADRTGIDIHLLTGPVVAVRGMVSGIPQGVSGISLDPRKVEPPRAPSNGLNSGARLGHNVNRDGSFVIWGLDPGVYQLIVRSNGAGFASASTEVTVAAKDVDGIQLRLLPLLNLDGSVVMEGGATIPRALPNGGIGNSPQLRLTEKTTGQMAFSVVAPDGSFHLKNLEPGIYTLSLSFASNVKSLRLGDTETNGSVLNLGSGTQATALTVTATNGRGRIGGVVRNSAGPVAGAHVQLLDADNPRMGVTSVTTRADGSYSFPVVPPGKYQVLALDPGTGNGGIRVDLTGYADILQTVEVQAGDSVPLDLRQHDR